MNLFNVIGLVFLVIGIIWLCDIGIYYILCKKRGREFFIPSWVQFAVCLVLILAICFSFTSVVMKAFGLL